MTNLLDGLGPGILVVTDSNDCPFEHEEHDCKGGKKNANTVAGNSKTLGENLKKKNKEGSTIVRKDEQPFSDWVVDLPAPYEAMPSVVPSGKPDDWNNWVQLIPGNENTWYPVLFQAHHLVPGDGSLKVAPAFLKYMDARARGSVVCCNLGYNVDGRENGLWLPGKSAVAQGKLGVVKLWGGSGRSLPDKEYADITTVGRREKGGSKVEDFVPLKGGTPSKRSKEPIHEVFHAHNMKWLYVQAAMRLATPHRQFHDSHKPYYDKVKDHLTDLGTVLDRFRKPGQQFACDKCSPKANAKIPAPPKLASVLNTLSSMLRSRLVGSPPAGKVYYTSEWSNKTKIELAGALQDIST